MGTLAVRARDKAVMFSVCCVLFVGCRSRRLEKDFFFKNPPATRIQRLRRYSLEDQYRLFRYGNDKFEPPLTGLAEPIAEKGKTVVPFLLGKVGPGTDDIAVRDVLLVFETMSSIRSYDVKSDELIMNTLRSRISTMNDDGWKTVGSHMLQRIEAK
jgi:hypothetical protein